MPHPTNPTYSTTTPREYLPTAEDMQRERIVTISLALKSADIEGHAALKHVVTNVIDDLDAVENIFTLALENYIAACEDVDRLADDHHPGTGAALAIEDNALAEIKRLMDEGRY